MATDAERADLLVGAYRRGTEEFSRFTGFSDGVFGFAMTLLISTVAIPVVQRSELRGALGEDIPDIVSYFVTFVVIGHYWLAHHRLFASLGYVTVKIMRMNLAYMAMIAFMPFPTALFGRYNGEFISLLLYVAALSMASLIEAAMVHEAHSSGAMRVPIGDGGYRLVIIASLIPAAVFGFSLVVAVFTVDWAPVTWLLMIPLELAVGRRIPAAERFLG